MSAAACTDVPRSREPGARATDADEQSKLTTNL
jgi:hypothetical protein